MKQKPFYNVHLLAITSLFSVLLIASCQKDNRDRLLTNDGDNPESTGSVTKKPGTIPIVYLSLTMANTAGDRLTSDQNGSYVNGSQGVSAKFDQYGNFIFGIGPVGHGASATLQRWINIDLSSPVVVYSNPPITGNDIVTAITTVPASGLTSVAMQNMEVGATQCITLTGGSNAGWVMNFHRGAEDVNTSQSSYMVVTRNSTTQWTMTPVGSCSPNSNVCALRNGSEVLYGYYNMPFSFTLTAQ